MMDECQVILEGDLSMSRIPHVLSLLEPLWDPLAPVCPVHFNLRDVTFIWPSAITLLTTAVIRLQQDGFSIRITRPRKENVDNYLNRIDFYDLVGMEVDYPWQRHSADGRFREVVQVPTEAEGDSVVREIMTVVSQNVEGVAGIYDAIYHTFLEVMNNVFHHAHSPTHGVLCAQHYPWLQRVELSVVDSGRGIPVSLGQNPDLKGRFTNAAEAIELAIQPRVTGRPEYNTGEGLFFSLEFIKANEGKACIYSQDGVLWLEDGLVRTESASFWPGTLVALRFCTDRPVDTRAIFDRYVPPESDFDWLF
jgi:hypothetical protein